MRLPQLFICRLAFGDIARDLGGTHDPASRILHRRYGQRNIDSLAAFREADRFIMLDALTGSQSLQNLPLFTVQLRGNNDRNRLSNDFCFRISKNTLRASVPTGDHSVKILGDDPIVGRLHNGSH